MPEGGGKKVVGVGLACLDQVLLWRDMAAPVAENLVLDFQVQGGGPVGTALVTVARLGGQAEFWGAVGSDWTADMVLSGLRDEGVDVSQVRRVEGGRGPLVVVCVDEPTGDRRFLHGTQVPPPDEAIGDLTRLADAGCLLLDQMQFPSALRAAREARRLGTPVVLDLTGRPGDGTRELLEFVDYVIASEYCVRALDVDGDPRRACEALAETGPACAVVTLGARGLVALSDGRFTELPAFSVDVVDTTGAGDVFHGAFCYGLVAGFALEANLAFSSATAALKCRRLGGRAGIPARAEVDAFLRDRTARSG